MINLKTLKDENRISAFFEKAKLQRNEHSFCLTAENRGEVLGFCLFDLDDKKIVIRAIEPTQDISLADGILRSTLHVATERSIMDSFYAETAPEELFKKLCFIKNEAERRLDTDKLFQSCHSCADKLKN